MPMDPVPPGLEDLYDDRVLARIDGAAPEGTPPDETPVDAVPVAAVPRYPVARRLGLTGTVLAGAMLGVAEVLEPERARQHIIEHVPDEVDESRQLVTYHHVAGDPRASRVVVRPWLLDRFRRSRR
jgi:hypothetical protein